MRAPITRDLVIQRYAPALLARHYGAALPADILPLDTAEANIIAQIATQFSPAARVAGDAALAEAAACIARHYDSPTHNAYWKQQLEGAYEAAEDDNTSGLRLGSDLTPVPPAVPSANPGAAVASSSADPRDDVIDEAKRRTPDAFALQKQRLLLLLANKHKDLAYPVTEDEKAVLTKFEKIKNQEKRALTDRDVEFFTVGLVQFNTDLTKNPKADPDYYSDDHYVARIKAADDEAWIKLRQKWDPKKGGTAYKNPDDFKVKSRVTEGFRFFLATVLFPLGYGRIILDLYKARSEGNRTKGNAAALGVMIAGAMLPFMILSLGLMPAALPFMGAISVGILKLAALILGAAAVANPVGAVIVLSLIVLAAVTFLGVLAYRAYQARGVKPSLQSMDPQVQRLYEKNGYSVEQVKKAIADLAARKQHLEGLQPSDRVKEELAKVNRQLEALRGNPTGMAAAFGMASKSEAAAEERFETARGVLAEYAKEHASTMGISADTFFQPVAARQAAETSARGYALTPTPTPASAAAAAATPGPGGAGATPVATSTTASSFDPDTFGRLHGCYDSAASAPTLRGP